ncbi:MULTISPECIES: hypothetical protein [Pseudonocardia]|uniref:Uncharacterized protein n=2 Tax=Pseudonocardia TaxID=1847 RepID=A0A1Y2MM13_PSEAH|nr:MULTISPECIES: hypothetical protein [Pseudonocardia]OSY36192.1 hypothetical protein BG845_05590 [Pseudonocardia autotrophica]TDN76625.1 hypothetical protein C8E95_5840 [Pseudonocardia autotrophica]BBG00625.1 hypothetical protein Pdca_18340 [Pseudonocardia autotrophica]GEC28021.1 hypothetical protein PSA01_50500 [Pseudonocardia saturnea]
MTRSTHGGHSGPVPWDGGGRAARHAALHERRRAMRAHRGDRRPARPLARVAAGAGVLILAGTVVVGVGVVIAVIAQVLLVLLVGMVALGVHGLLRNAARQRAAAAPPLAAGAGAAVTAEQAWRRARADFQRLRAEFLEHETDPMAVLRRPALSDVAVPSTARFVDAFSAAQALDTDGYPGEPYGASYLRAVEAARRAWRAAVEAADRIRLSGLSPEERRTVERVVKLLTTARDSDSEPERLAAYARARSELDRLDRAGIVHLPTPARAQLDARARGELPGA